MYTLVKQPGLFLLYTVLSSRNVVLRKTLPSWAFFCREVVGFLKVWHCQWFAFFEVRYLGQGFSTLALLTFDSRCFFVVGSSLVQCKMHLTSLVSQLADASSPCPSLIVSIRRVSRHCQVCLSIWQKPWLTGSYWHRSSTLYLNLPVCASLQIWIDTGKLTKRRC